MQIRIPYYGFEQVHFLFQIKENLFDVTNISNLIL